MRWGEVRRNERGATSIIVGLLLVALLGFTAIGVDLGALWSDRKQLQNGADAGALAIAQACAAGNCGAYNATANAMAGQNKLDANATADSVTFSGQSVTVTTVSTRQHWFAPVIGVNSSVVRASATAAWGNGGGTTLPIAFSSCAFWLQTGATVGAPTSTTAIYNLTLKSKETAEDVSDAPVACPGVTNAAHNEVSGGFGWLAPTSSTACVAEIDALGNVASKPGASQPCNLDLAALKTSPVLVPIFDQAGGSGSGAWYHIRAFAAFQITAFCLPQGEWNVTTCNAGTDPDKGRRIMGRFVTWVTLDEASATGTYPDLGVRFVKITG